MTTTPTYSVLLKTVDTHSDCSLTPVNRCTPSRRFNLAREFLREDESNVNRKDYDYLKYQPLMIHLPKRKKKNLLVKGMMDLTKPEEII